MRKGRVRVDLQELAREYQNSDVIEFLDLSAENPIIGDGDSGGAAYLVTDESLEIIGINLAGASYASEDGTIVSREFSLTNIAPNISWIECSFFHASAKLPSSFSPFEPSQLSCHEYAAMASLQEFQEMASNRCTSYDGWSIVYNRYCLPTTADSCAAMGLSWQKEQGLCDYSELGFVAPPGQ